MPGKCRWRAYLHLCSFDSSCHEGSCDIFEENQAGHERFNIFKGCPMGRTTTIVLRGGAYQMEINRYLRQHALTIVCKSQLLINSYAKALEVIPRQLCDNTGFDATYVLNKLRQKHALSSGKEKPFGVDINTVEIADSFANFQWEPAVVKINASDAAIEEACLIFSVDETVKNPKSESAQRKAAARAMCGRVCGHERGMRRR